MALRLSGLRNCFSWPSCFSWLKKARAGLKPAPTKS